MNKLRMKKYKNQNAFTLLELLVVIAIIGILTAIGVVSYSAAQERARDTRRKQDVEAMSKAFEQYYADNVTYPTNVIGCGGVSSYLTQGKLPLDPQDGSNYICTTSTSTFCVCATLEVETAGNSNNACGFNATTHYCVTNQQ